MKKGKNFRQRVAEKVKDRLNFEREWLVELLGAVRAGRFFKRLFAWLVSLPRRLWQWFTDLVRELFTGPPAEREPEAGVSWVIRVLPFLALLILGLVLYLFIPRRTDFEQFPIFTSAPQQRVLVIYEGDESEALYAEPVRALGYAHLQYDTLNLAQDDNWPNLSRYSAILLTTGLLDQARARSVTGFVENGGGLVALYREWNPHLAPLFGIEVEEGITPERLADVSGLQFEADFFPGVEGLFVGRKLAPGHEALALPLQPQARVVATSTMGQPLAWLYRYGQGRTLFWNTAWPASKQARGFIVQSIMSVQGVGVLPMANVAMIQIDGFPGPLPADKLEPVKSEYDLLPVQFYNQVWWPDMVQLARRYGLVYTFLLTFSQEEQVQGPFDFTEWEETTLELDGHRLVYPLYAAHRAIQEGELGLSGYNPVPLTAEHWSGPEMEAALQAAAERWTEDELLPMPAVYAPPQNRYDQAGALALAKAMPSLQVICGSYSEGQPGSQEFGAEPDNRQLFALPRATSGYNMDSEQRLAMLSQVSTMGAWTHYIRPADLFDTPQNRPDAAGEYGNPYGRGWRQDETGGENGYYYRFARWMNFAHQYYPWLRYLRTTEAAEAMRVYLANQVVVDMKPYALSLQSASPTYFQVRINDRRRLDLNDIQGAQFLYIYEGEGYTIYTLRGLGPEVHLSLLLPEPEVYQR